MTWSWSGCPCQEVDAAGNRLLVVMAVGIALALAVLALVAWWVIRLGVRPIKRMTATATAIAEGDLSQRVEPAAAGTEAAELGTALNTMLGQIETSFAVREASEERLRQFVADASHELRTPVTSIRGYAELYQRGCARRRGQPQPGHAPDRAGSHPHGPAHRRPPVAGPARPGPPPRAGARRPRRRSWTTRCSTRGPSIPSGPSRPTSRAASRSSATSTASTRCWPTSWATPCGTHPARRPCGSPGPAGPRRRAGGARRRPRHAARRRGAGLRALLPRRPVALSRPRRVGARAVDRAGHRRGPRRFGRASTPRPAGARPCASSCPSTRARRRHPRRPPRARPPSARAEGSG